MTRDKKDSPIDRTPDTLPEAKIILAFLKHRLDELEKQLEDASKSRESMAESLACFLNHGVANEQYRQDIVVMRVQLDRQETELKTLRIQHDAFVAQVLRDRAEREDLESIRRQHRQQGPPTGNPPDEPDFGGSLIDAFADAALPPTAVPEDWVAGSPPPGNLMEFGNDPFDTNSPPLSILTGLREEQLGAPPGPSGINGAPDQVASDQEINWEDWVGLIGPGPNPDRVVENDNGSDVPTEPFTRSETEQIYRRFYPHLLPNLQNMPGEAQVNESVQASASEEWRPTTVEDASDGNGKGRKAHRDEPTDSESGSGSSDIKGKGKAVDQGTTTARATTGESSVNGSQSAITHAAPTVLRTGLHHPSLLEGTTSRYTTPEPFRPTTLNYDHFTRHGRTPSFFEFGIQFDPPPNSRNNPRSTVLIENLPSNITMNTLMPSVRGGAVLRATIVNTTPITGTPTALVTFVEPQAAADYVAFANIHPIRFSGFVAAVTLVATPNFPMPFYLQQAVRLLNQTRALRLSGIQDPSHFTTDQLLRDLDLEWASRLGLIENIHHLDGSTVDLTFSSLEVALHAFHTLRSTQVSHHTAGAYATFLPDPSSLPLESLLRYQARLSGHLQQDNVPDEDLYDPDAPDDAYDDADMSDYEPNDGFGDVFRPPTPKPEVDDLTDAEVYPDLGGSGATGTEDGSYGGDEEGGGGDNAGEGPSTGPPAYTLSLGELESLISSEDIEAHFLCPAIHQARAAGGRGDCTGEGCVASGEEIEAEGGEGEYEPQEGDPDHSSVALSTQTGGLPLAVE
ncbi:hypothetical protein FGG08_005213 [Glutinoglossum americanum]|uniref:RRM domain-containing protein n=1 Tax=Glutinoglossum americanum TaxID=1670608 RepID=A0A9P8KW84_9PEZI|nr:hypothetical protein FGG08_005213 [Glutinoglossum americanum]